MTANISIQTNGGDPLDFATTVLGNVVDASFSSEQIMITAANGDRFVMKGSFAYSGAEQTVDSLKSGTITSIVLQDNPGSRVHTAIGSANLDALETIDVLMNGSPSDFFALLGALRYTGSDGSDVMRGSALDDELIGGGGGDVIAGGDGDDFIEGGAGQDELAGSAGIDTLSYKSSASKVSVSLLGTASGGDAFGDILSGFENLLGSDFDDKLWGSNAANFISGGQGDDKMLGGAGADTLVGGGGDDTLYYDGSNSINVNLETGRATGSHAEGDRIELIENVVGSNGKDTIKGDGKNNVLSGGDGDDLLDGGINQDTLIGGAGFDRLIGGQGLDTLTGGKDNDVFVLANTASNADTITDFYVGKDKLEIDASLFGGDLTARQILTGKQIEVNTTGSATEKETRFILNKDTGELFFDSNGSGGGDIGLRLIATLDGVLGGFSFGEFIIV